MKKQSFKLPLQIVILLLSVLTLFSCENSQDVMSDIESLKSERNQLQKDVYSLIAQKQEEKESVDSLLTTLKELGLYKDGKQPQYILKLKLKQSHFSLDISDHVKDAMNAIEFEMPVSKEFYASVNENTEIIDEFRFGSFVLNGSYGDWEMTVEGKEIR